jgi:hypothetical protein
VGRLVVSLQIIRQAIDVIYEIVAPGGKGGIRTRGRLAPTEVFKTSALNHSATFPNLTRGWLDYENLRKIKGV